MQLIAATAQNVNIRREFFKAIFGKHGGYIAVAYKRGQEFKNEFFHYPENLEALLAWVNNNLNQKDLYYCPQLFVKPKRVKANVTLCPTVWADIDLHDDPNSISPKPTVLIESSPGRYQGLWLLEEPASPKDGELASRKLAYSIGADNSGWDLTQLLRIPLTYNMKYDESPVVQIEYLDDEIRYPLKTFEAIKLPELPEGEVEYPKDVIEELSAESVLFKHGKRLAPVVFSMFHNPPEEKDWSTALWSLQCMLLEAGLTREETFVVAWDSAVNKYKRDGRSPGDLWKEVCKAEATVAYRQETKEEVKITNLLTKEERKKLPRSFVDDYIDWAVSKTDAAKEYHQAGAFTVLSALLSECVRLPTSFGTVVPNLWFMILGDTTLTRKTTAMDMAMDLLLTVYDDCVVATDGSMEGLITALSTRSGRTSLFWRDEFSGMLDAMRKKDYNSGLMESLTKLYDGKYQKRILRKETIEVRDPIFIMFCGGIKSRILEISDVESVISGFFPRFIFIVAEPTLDGFKPAGPATGEIKADSTKLLTFLSELRQRYDASMKMLVGGSTHESKRVWDAKLSKEAWDRYNLFERTVVEWAIKTDAPELFTPSVDRLAKSTLKAAVLLAASRQDPTVNRGVLVEVTDVLKAISYAEEWLEHTTYVISNVGKTVSERTLERALMLIQSGKGDRGSLMRAMHLNAREAELVITTLEQRSQIVRTKSGKKELLYPT